MADDETPKPTSAKITKISGGLRESLIGAAGEDKNVKDTKKKN